VNIALNLLYLLPGAVGGTETYAHGLLTGLASVAPEHHYTCYVNQRAAAWPLPATGRFRRVVCPVDGSRRWARYAYEQARLPLVLAASRADLVHSLGYVSPIAARCPSVVTVHDLNYRSPYHSMSLERRLALRAFVELSVRRADAVITDSEHTRHEICTFLRADPRRVHVAHLAPRVWDTEEPNAAEREDTRVRLGLDKPYTIAFASSSANKNIPRLVRAFALARRQGVTMPLALIGHSAGLASDPAVQSAQAAGWLRATGYLDDRTLRCVLSDAAFLVFPSLYEGFGLPVLEAMSLGVPVVCSRIGPLPEVAGEAALYIDPTSVDDIARGIAKVAADPHLRAALSAAGLQRASVFTWEATARMTLAIYERVANGAGSLCSTGGPS